MTDSLKHELTLVLGGAKSGKSDFALRYVEEHFQTYLFLATAHILDEEMGERIKRHKESRGPFWRLIEEPIDVPRALRERCSGVDAVLVDCLTVWLSNILIEKGDGQVPVYEETLLKALSKRSQSVVVVSNEVGAGIVPENPLGRKFRDLAGELNQKIAKMADKVVFSVAGIPTYLKGNSMTV